MVRPEVGGQRPPRNDGHRHQGRAGAPVPPRRRAGFGESPAPAKKKRERPERDARRQAKWDQDKKKAEQNRVEEKKRAEEEPVKKEHSKAESSRREANEPPTKKPRGEQQGGAGNQRDGKPQKKKPRRGAEEEEEEPYAPNQQREGPQEAIAIPPSWKKSPTAAPSTDRRQKQREVIGRKRPRHNDADSLMNSFQARLAGSTFRLLNEQLYTSNSSLGAQLLRDEQTFDEYHDGYRKQLAMWPAHPALVVADALLNNRFGYFSNRHYQFGKGDGGTEIGYRGKVIKSGKGDGKPIPTDYVIADMGCGDADIAQRLSAEGYKKVHSFDFRAANSFVTAADMSKVPLESGSCDVVIFSLSLMSTNFMSYLFEAKRLLKEGKLLKIVEVRSRLPRPNDFSWLVSELGFRCEAWGVLVDYFCVFDFTRIEGGVEGVDELSGRVDPSEVLLPCLYKRR